VDQKLLSDLWTLVHGDHNEGVSIDTLRVVLLNCIGIKVADRERAIHNEEEVKLRGGDEAAE
jgi:hypothetical protein